MTDMPQTANLRRQLAEIHEWWTETAVHYEDPVALGAILLQELMALSRDLAAGIRDVETTLHKAMTDYEVAIDGVGILTKHVTAESEKYESEALLREVVDTIPRVDPETGEILIQDNAVQSLFEVLNLTLPITATLGWRKRGLDQVLGKAWREDHYEKVPGRKSVRFQ